MSPRQHRDLRAPQSAPHPGTVGLVESTHEMDSAVGAVSAPGAPQARWVLRSGDTGRRLRSHPGTEQGSLPGLGRCTRASAHRVNRRITARGSLVSARPPLAAAGCRCFAEVNHRRSFRRTAPTLLASGRRWAIIGRSETICPSRDHSPAPSAQPGVRRTGRSRVGTPLRMYRLWRPGRAAATVLVAPELT